MTRPSDVEFLDIDAAEARDLTVPDVYYSPRYARSARHIDGGVWEVAVAGGGEFLFPYVKRPVPGHDHLYDLVSPYGYSTVLAPTPDERRRFVEAFRTASRERGLVAEFIRGHPFDMIDPETDGLPVGGSRTHPTYTVDLSDGGVEGYWEACEGRHRTAVRKGERTGLEVAEVSSQELEQADSGFRRLYEETMERVRSATRLRVGDAYYRDLRSGLGDAVRVVTARLNEELVAASIFLLWADRAHYHLSGSTTEGMRNGATNAILDYAIRHVVPEGGRLHLGGGITPGDGLDRFKRSVGNVPTTVHLCHTIVDHQRYEALIAEAGVDDNTDYFPAYRA